MSDNIQFVHVPNANLAKSLTAQVTIEAEYGSYVMEGTMYTAAHHQATGPYAGRHLPGLEQTGRPSPCNDKGIPILSEGVVAVSHIDLDTIGGCLRTVDFHRKLFGEEFEGFWALAEHIDVTGPHRLDRSHEWADHLLAFWAWLRSARERYPREYVQDCTDFIHHCGWALNDLLLTDDEEMLQAGREMAEAEDALNTSSLAFMVEAPNGLTIAVREAPAFVNHLYQTPTGRVCDVVVALNSVMKSVTVSLAEPIEGVSCRDIVQGVWTEVTATSKDGEPLGTYPSPGAALAAHPDCTWAHTAGGHAGIAGSPRGREMSRSDLLECLTMTLVALSPSMQAS